MNYIVNIWEGLLSIDRMSIGNARKMMLLTSAVGFVIALVAYIGFKNFDLNNESSDNYIFIIIGGILGLGALVGSLFAGKVLRRYPEKILFNNEKGVVEIFHLKSVTQKVSIPYQYIAGFEVRSYQVAPQSNKSIFEDRYYSVVMRLKDDSVWELTEGSRDSSYTEGDLEKILQYVRLETSAEKLSTPSSIQNSRFSLLYRGDELKIIWKNFAPILNIRWIVIALILMAITGFAAHIIVSIASEEEGRTWEIIMRSISVEFNELTIERTVEILGGPLTFTILAFAFWAVIALFNLIIITIHRMKINGITMTNSFFSSKRPNLNVPIQQIGNIHFNYLLNGGERFIQIDKEKIEYRPLISEMPDLSKVKDFKSFAKMSFQLFKSSIKEFSKRDFAKEEREIEVKKISTFDFEKFSPVDVAAIYLSLKQKIKLDEN